MKTIRTKQHFDHDLFSVDGVYSSPQPSLSKSLHVDYGFSDNEEDHRDSPYFDDSSVDSSEEERQKDRKQSKQPTSMRSIGALEELFSTAPVETLKGGTKSRSISPSLVSKRHSSSLISHQRKTGGRLSNTDCSNLRSSESRCWEVDKDDYETDTDEESGDCGTGGKEASQKRRKSLIRNALTMATRGEDEKISRAPIKRSSSKGRILEALKSRSSSLSGHRRRRGSAKKNPVEEDTNGIAQHKPKRCSSLKSTSARRFSLDGSAFNVMKERKPRLSRRKSLDQSDDILKEDSGTDAVAHKPKRCSSLKSLSTRRLSLDESTWAALKDRSQAFAPKPKLSRKKSFDRSDDISEEEDSGTAVVDHKPNRCSSLKSLSTRRLSLDESILGTTKSPKPRLSRRKSFDRSDDILEEDYSDDADQKPKSCHSLKPTSSRRLSLNGSTSSGIMKDQNVKPSRKKSYDQSNDNFEEASDVASGHKPRSCLSLKSVSSRRLSLDGSALGVMKERKPKLSRKKSCDGSDETLKDDSSTALVDHKPKRRSSLKSAPSRRLSLDDSLTKERISLSKSRISKRKSHDQSSDAISGDDNSSQKSSSVRRKQRSKPIQMAESSSSLESKEETTRRKTSMNSTASGDKTPKQRKASAKTKSFTGTSSDSIRSASPKSLSATLETEKQSLKNGGKKSSKKLDGAKRDGTIKSKKSKSQNGTELNEKISASIQKSSKGSKEFEVFKYHQDEKLHQKMMRRRNSCFT